MSTAADRDAHAPRPAQPSEVIITHVGADFDGIASLLCARRLYPSAVPLLAGPPDASVRAFLDAHGADLAVAQARHVDRMPLTRVVMVDVQVPSRLGPFREVVADPRVEVHVYDHHPPTMEGVRGDVHCVEAVGATTTLLVNRLMALPGGPPALSSLEATLYAIGIHGETGNLTFPDTTPQDVRAVAWLLEQGARLSVVADYTQAPLRDEQHLLLQQMLSGLQIRTVRGMRILLALAQTEAYVGEAATVAHRIMDLERPDALVCVLRMGARVFLIGRSRESGPDVGALLARFGGGGHARAASASTSLPAAAGSDGATAIEAVAARVWDVIEAEARPPISARDIMSTPVQAVEMSVIAEPTVDDARALFARYGHSVLPVLRQGRLEGAVSRRDVDRAHQHGLGETPAQRLVTPGVPTASADAGLSELLRRMGPHERRLVVVDAQGRAQGVVTRADVLEALRLQSQPVETERAMLDALPIAMRRFLARCGEVGETEGMKVWVVGGFVRDTLLGRQTQDIDLVVEGDGIRYAQALAGALGGRISPHSRFGTAVVTLPSDANGSPAHPARVDVASTRVEFYTRPAALPEVAGSTLKQDLYRRDFTVNALALSLAPASFGQQMDFFGGRRDLVDGVVRVLHNLSFIDDPTRIFRAIKYEQRYHFRMEPHTERLLRQAVHARMLEALSPARVRDEMHQILSEARPLPAIDRMAGLGVLRLLHPALHLTPRVRALLESVTAVLSAYADVAERARVQRWAVYFRALVSGLDAEALQAVGERYGAGEAVRERLFLGRAQVQALLRRLHASGLAPSEVYRLLAPLSLEMVLYLLARARSRTVKAHLVLFIERLRETRAIVRGRDLIAWGAPPGPALGRTLEALFDAQLDGRIADVDDARAWLDEKDIPASWT